MVDSAIILGADETAAENEMGDVLDLEIKLAQVCFENDKFFHGIIFINI